MSVLYRLKSFHRFIHTDDHAACFLMEASTSFMMSIAASGIRVPVGKKV